MGVIFKISSKNPSKLKNFPLRGGGQITQIPPLATRLPNTQDNLHKKHQKIQLSSSTYTQFSTCCFTLVDNFLFRFYICIIVIPFIITSSCSPLLLNIPVIKCRDKIILMIVHIHNFVLYVPLADDFSFKMKTYFPSRCIHETFFLSFSSFDEDDN